MPAVKSVKSVAKNPGFQRTLFDPPSPRFHEVARSRGTDPETSFKAALRTERSGRAATQRGRCLAAVHKVPGLTAAEIAALIGIERHAASRRLPDLRRMCFVNNAPDGQTSEEAVKAAERICRVQGTASMTWWPRRRGNIATRTCHKVLHLAAPLDGARSEDGDIATDFTDSTAGVGRGGA